MHTCTSLVHTPGADLGFLNGGLFLEKHWCWKQGDHGGMCPPDFLKRGHRGAPCYEEMYLDLSITSDDNAMLSGSTISQEPGWCPDSIKYLVTYEKCMHALRLHQT